MIGTYAHIAVSNMSGEEGGHLRATAVPSICSALRLIRIGPRCTNEKLGRKLYHESEPERSWMDEAGLHICTHARQYAHIHVAITVSSCYYTFQWTQSQSSALSFMCFSRGGGDAGDENRKRKPI